MKNIKLFETVSDYTEARGSEYIEPWVSYVRENEQVDYNKSEYEKLLETPLTFETTSDGNIVWKLSTNTSDTSNTKTIQYKLNDGDWTSITSTKNGTSISVVSGDTVQFRGNNDSYHYSSFRGTTCGFKVKGNIMSLINPTNYATMTSFPENSEWNFYCLFQSCTGLTDASELILPATTLTTKCYTFMFSGCTSLTTALELPATTLAEECYHGMFLGCTSLTQAPSILPATTLANKCYIYMFWKCTGLVNAPELPATTLASDCYEYMFSGCTSLTTAPELPATTLVNYCYYQMFAGCTSLNYIKCLATNISASYCKSNWVNGVASSGTFVKAAGITESTWGRGNNGIPNNWTVQNAS